MRSSKSSLVSATVILLVITTSANADRKLIDLGPGVAYSINDKGQIVGASSSYSGGYAILFDSTGGKANKNISPIISGSRFNGAAYSINNNGQIVGYIGSSANSGSAYLFDSTGGGGGTLFKSNIGYGSTATAINDNGLIVGYIGDESSAARFGLSPRPNIVTFGGNYSYACAVNNNGKIVGQYCDEGPTHYGAFFYACIFDSSGSGTNIDLGTITGYSTSAACSINNLDQIVGWSFKTSSDPIYNAVLFDSTGGGANINLGALDTYYNKSIAKSINDNGQIVGYAYSYYPTISSCHAVLFDSTGQGNNIDLNTLIDPRSGWYLATANCINNNGWIVGSMTNSYGNVDEAFLLTPEPATLLLFAIGVPITSGLRKRRI